MISPFLRPEETGALVDLLRTGKSAVELPDILSDHNVKAAAKLLHRYYHERDEKGLLSTGSYFDEWAGRGDIANKDVITDSDAVAVSMLSVTVPAKAMIGLAEPETAARISDLLEQIPTDTALSSLSHDQAEALLTDQGPAALLWRSPQHEEQPLGHRPHDRKQDHGQETAPPDPHLG